MGKRSERVGEMILAEISRLLLREVKDPRIGFVTLTGIDLSDDLRHAKVYISALGDEGTKQKTLQGLSSCAGFLRGRLGRELRLRYVPELDFHWDTSIAHGVRISHVIDELKESREAAAVFAMTQVAELIQNSQSFVITSHIDPDGDALGGLLGLGLFLRQMGKQVALKHVQPVPETYRFLPGSELIEVCPVNREPYQVGIMVDCGDMSRVGTLFQERHLIGTFINIDHHESNGGFGDYNLLDPKAAASSEIVYRLISAVDPGKAITADIATNLFTGILVDTGSFHYGNTTPEVLMVVADLVARGASPAGITRNLYEQRSLPQLRLLGEALLTVECALAGRVSLMVVSEEMYRQTGTTAGDTEDLVNFAGSLAGVEVAILLKQKGTAQYKASLRAKDRVNVALVAERFGGGGHPNAAGCHIDGTPEEVKARLLSVIQEFL
ncbi:MAG: 30S ribosome-binding factor RbfA [Candidatus Tectomicrobia bacterium]|uniref:Ribosome-binding factor A n=1 Tax=Tectimicrobiota bacterium TaxID=2528274 RepID=A0A932M0P2_UNCTE|nr:30S ribosome-binding factor RbfA [Candidatus Tectomicrobia bacterium]